MMEARNKKEEPGAFLPQGSDEWVMKGAKVDETLVSPTREAGNKRHLEDQGVDGSILDVIGNVRQILRATLTSATSSWTTTKRLDVLHNSGTEEYYFVRIYEGEDGEMAARGCYEAARVVGEREATFIPRCVGWGRILGGSIRKSFVVSKFYELAPGSPDPCFFAAKLARLHEAREGEEGKKGRFGFGRSTYVGCVRQEVGWCDDWEAFFGKKLAAAAKRCEERGAVGWEGVLGVLHTVLGKVVPRLLRPLETRGRRIKPAFLVGNLRVAWVVDEDEEEVVVLEPAGFWGHGEYELGPWKRRGGNIHDSRRETLLDQSHAEAYHKRIPKSEPVEDYEDRIALYSALHNIYLAANFPKLQHPLRLALEQLNRLMDKYPDGYVDQ